MGQPEQRAEGAGPFTTRLTWHLPGGGTAVWESRLARRRGIMAVRPPGAPTSRHTSADEIGLRRLRRLNATAAIAFIIGGALFAAGAGVAQVGSGDATTSAAIYFAGGLFFNTGGYVSLLQVINAPRHVPGGEGRLVTRGWRWWSYEPGRVDWLSTFVLFAGTLVFGVNLLDSFLHGLSVRQMNRLIWTPDVIGCVLFLISGHLAFAEICHGRICLRSRSLGWWIVAVNQLGSVLFMISALAAYTRPATDSLINADIANWGTFSGALCFSIGGFLQLYERP
ncbi:NADH-ubiquinone oxidoreductase [Streptomyces sp. 142MFCol3.1]|uniref:NADH-ubiquinone oxidoreductase n=1 Tax=Streptomyces sp. 142MFCol3.1 TaxID=1172179 RepID=UPI0003FFF9F5|nr:NADH-ubiquinone oxidoreductase [Streptomyces sp. 142MFCol3.1]